MLYAAVYRGTSDQSFLRKAEDESRAAVRMEPLSTKNHYQLARLYELASEPGDAASEYQVALRCSPNEPKTLLLLARCYELLGRDKDALDLYSRMVRLEQGPYGTIRAVPELVEPEYVFAHAAIGRAMEKKGGRRSALREYNQAMDRIKRYQESVEGWGTALEMGIGRDTEMEQQVDELRSELSERISALTRPADGTAR
jgi:tetratricopeptide (TPR) repeat protein